MIELKKILKVVNVNGKNIPILNNIDLEIDKGDFTVITGKSGSGKSTLLNVIAGFDSKSSGSYFYNGQDITNESQRRNIRKETGYVTQNYALIHNETVKNNILLALGVSKELKSLKSNLKSILTKLDIEKLENVKVSNLSGGEKQRVAIARALIKNPKILLLDEPTGNLDEENSKIVIEIIKQIHNSGVCVILVTHDIDYMNIGTKSIHLVDGSISI